MQQSPPNIDTTDSVPEDTTRLTVLQRNVHNLTNVVLNELQRDQVVLIQKVIPADADAIIAEIAEKLGLQNQLAVQSTFASIHGHRHNVGKYFMSVNQRSDYQFIPPHSEGTQATNMQLASLYSYENTTDGGTSILMNTNDDSSMWASLKALVTKVDLGGRTLSQGEIAAAKMMYQINIPADLLAPSDKVLCERKSPVVGVKLFDVLAKPSKTYSRILKRDVNVYWDSVASTDFDSGEEYFHLLRDSGLLKEPIGGGVISQLDNANPRRVWRSGVKFAALFKAKLTLKLLPGDLIIQNNLTWTHSTSNWTPNSGTRKVVAAFA